MREVLAASNHDFVLSEPASKLKFFWEKLRVPNRRASRHSGRRRRRIASHLAAAFFVATSAVILLNALVWQKSHHSTLPVLRATPAAPAKAPKNGDALATQASKHVPPEASQDEAHKRPAGKPPQELSQARANVLPDSAHDQIADLLQVSPPPSAKPSASAEKAPGPSKAVLNAQRALVKLGFVLKADGIAGATSKKAIARYERDHGLPVHGQFTPALMRRLSAEAGISIK